MDRFTAKDTIYKIINSGIISEELEEELVEVANCICFGFEECSEPSPYCEGCVHISE